MASIYNKLGTFEHRTLLADPEGCDIIVIPCAPGNGVITMGTVMKRGENGMYSAAAAADVVATNYLAVLDEDVDTNASETVAQNANAYRAGRLIATKVKLAADAALSAANIAVLRGQGIVLDPMAGEGEAFNNSTGA